MEPKAKGLVCDRCGGPIDTKIPYCGYCGCSYSLGDNVRVFRPAEVSSGVHLTTFYQVFPSICVSTQSVVGSGQPAVYNGQVVYVR